MLTRAVAVVFLFVSIFCLLFAYRCTYSNCPAGGDCPYFLVTVKSIVNDGDLWISPGETDYGNYVEFCWRRLEKGFRLVDQDRHRYSCHPFGVVPVVVPFFAVGGRLGIYLWLTLLNILAGFGFYRFFLSLTGDRACSLAAAVLLLLNPVVLGIGASLFPGSVFLPLFSLFLYLIVERPCSRAMVSALSALVLVYLCFTHLRYVPFVVATCLVLLSSLTCPPGDLIDRPRFFASAGAALFAWGCFVHHLTGGYGINSFFLTAGKNSKLDFSASVLFRHALLGNLFDQQVGLFFFVPVLACSFAGLVLFYRENNRFFPLLAAPSFVYYLFVGSFSNWTGGWAPPCRFLLPLFPLLFAGLAFSLRAVRRTARPVAAAVIIGVAALLQSIVVLMVFAYPTLLLPVRFTYNNQNTLFVALYNWWKLNLIDYFPKLILPAQPYDLALCLVLFLAVVLFNYIILKAETSPGKFRDFRAAAGLVAIVFLAFVVCSTRRPSQGVSPLATDIRLTAVPSRYLFNYDQALCKAATEFAAGNPALAVRLARRSYYLAPSPFRAYILSLTYYKKGDYGRACSSLLLTGNPRLNRGKMPAWMKRRILELRDILLAKLRKAHDREAARYVKRLSHFSP